MRFPRKTFNGLKRPLGSEGGDGQGESDRMIWAAACGGRPSSSRRGGTDSSWGPWVLAPSNRARTKVKMFRFLPESKVTEHILNYPGVFWGGHLCLGQMDNPSSPLCFRPLSPAMLETPWLPQQPGPQNEYDTKPVPQLSYTGHMARKRTNIGCSVSLRL